MTEEKIVTDAELNIAYANFGPMKKRDVIRLGVLKCASGYYQGRTSTCIIIELGLVDNNYTLTPKGRAYLWAAFSGGSNF